jgi:hypothetical protein
MTPLVIRMALQLGASLMIIILTTLEVLFELSIMLLESIYSTGITHDHHLRLSYFNSRGHWCQCCLTFFVFKWSEDKYNISE